LAPQTISVSVTEDHAVVALRGEHEAYTADKLARQVAGLIDEGVSVTVDLQETTYVDSTVVGVLLAATRRAAERDVRFALRLGHETGWPVRRVLEVTGLVTQS
jgi:anti-anti-sigma factor